MANKEIVITEYKGMTVAFKFESGLVSDLFIERKSLVNVNDIYVSRVTNVKDELNACFIDINGSDTGFLPFKDINENFLLNRKFDGKLKQGDLILCQVNKDKIKTKPYGITMNIYIPGKYSVITSEDKSIHVSSKLNKDFSKSLYESVKGLNKEFGFILRTNCLDADYEVIKNEILLNTDCLKSIVSNSKCRTLFSSLYKGKSSIYERINSLRKTDFDRIITDNNEVYSEFKDEFNVSLNSDKDLPLKVLYSLDKAFLLATDKKVYLKSGGYLIIEPTEALTVIDVNSGKFEKNISKETYIKKINTEACFEICRQLRLRNISGIILVDFINMVNAKDFSDLESIFKAELKKDIVKSEFCDFTKLSLCELTREKKYGSVYDCLKNI